MKKSFVQQFGKFVVTGLINTGIDFAVLNFLILISGYNKGYYVAIFATCSFLAATTNSFLMNKHWTFKGEAGKKAKDKTATDMGQFLAITLVGLLINAGITFSVSSYLPPFLGLLGNSGIAPDALQSYWVNFAKAGATGVSLIWNFVGYKFWVFKA